MTTQETINFERIAQAIDYIQANFKEQPELEEIARSVHLGQFQDY